MEFSDVLLGLGRVLLGGLFVYGGIKHYFIAPLVLKMMDARGVPAPKLVLAAGSVFQAVAGAALMAGLLVPFAALGLAGFTVAATIMLLNFWDMDGPARESAKNTCLSNAAIVGGLLIAATGS